jgi:carbon monoxide dehydrogenase subunit G
MAVVVSIEIAAPIEEVWAHAADFATHDEWMADAAEIEFMTDERSGVGTTMAVETKVGPLRTVDVIEVTDMEAPHRITVSHKGLFTGTGEFRLESVGELKTRFTWDERLDFPWYFGGPIGAAVAKPILSTIWRGNLRRLRLRIEGTPPD